MGEIVLPVLQDDVGIKGTGNPYLPLLKVCEGAWLHPSFCVLEAQDLD